ncbi:gustatory receptor 131 [Tribolium castaneum]|uniref:Gustatory receptor n=1 Tax=Tribolium castaneum TaxID=7070 RepID=D6WTL8_TRICA|nr:gustatory receptor 131 [Tribolium castaneum]
MLFICLKQIRDLRDINNYVRINTNQIVTVQLVFILLTKMSLLVNTPKYLKYVYKLSGILQFSETDSSVYQRLWCLPFYGYLIYLCVNYNISEYKTKQVFLLIDKFTNLANMLMIIIYFISCHRRSNNLKNLLTEVSNFGIFNLKISKRNWSRIILLTLLLLCLCYLPIQRNGLQKTFYIYLSPNLFQCLDLLFLNDLLNPITIKFQQINRILKKQKSSILCMQQIQNLSHLHHDLVNLTTKIVNNFDVTITVALAVWFESMIETIYYLIFLTKNDTKHSYVFYFSNFTLLLLCYSWLFILIGTLANVKSETDRTSTHIHDIWNFYACNRKIDARIRNLEFVSLQLLNTKLKFTPMNLFTLDWSFCHLIMASIATYVVILVQFYI